MIIVLSCLESATVFRVYNLRNHRRSQLLGSWSFICIQLSHKPWHKSLLLKSHNYLVKATAWSTASPFPKTQYYIIIIYCSLLGIQPICLSYQISKTAEPSLLTLQITEKITEYEFLPELI